MSPILATWRCWRCCCCRRRAELREALTRANSDTGGFWTPTASECSFVSAIDADLESGGWASDGRIDELRRILAEAAAEVCNALASLRQQSNGNAASHSGWHNVSVQGRSTCWVQTRRGGARSETKVAMSLDTTDQVAEMQMVHVTAARSVSGALQDDSVTHLVSGALPVLLEIGTWCRWFPMCNRSTVLRRWGPSDMLAQLDFKLPVINVHLLVYIYISVVDRLREEGNLDVFVCTTNSKFAEHCSRDEASEPQSVAGSAQGCSAPRFLDVDLPPFGLSKFQAGVQANVDVAMLRISPQGRDALQHEVQFTLVGQEPCPFDWLPRKIWATLSRNLVSVLAHRAATNPPLSVDARLAEFYQNIEQKLTTLGDGEEFSSVQHAERGS